MRINAAEWVHNHQKKEGALPWDSVFDPDNVDVSDITPGTYYGGFDIIPNYVNEMVPRLPMLMRAIAQI